MTDTYRIFLKLSIILEPLFVLLILCYHVYNTFQHNSIPNEGDIGYVDSVHYIRPFDDVLQGKVLQKDFYWFYGPLYLYFQVPFYSLFGANQYAVHILLFQFLPAVGIALSYFYIRLLIKNPFLRVLFLITCIFHWVNSSLSAPRHLGAELGLAFFLFSLTRIDSKWIPIWAGFFMGVGLLSGSEYGVPAFLVIFLGFLLCRLSGYIEIPNQYFVRFDLGSGIALAPFISYMLYHEALWNYVEFTFTMIKNFGANNPGRGAMFPPFPEMSLKAVFSQAFRFYLPLLVYFSAMFIFVIKFFITKRSGAIGLFVLSGYGLLIYYRVLAGPAYGYFVYGLIPAITLVFFLLEYCWSRGTECFREKQYPVFACHFMVVAVSLGWVCLTLENKNFLQIEPGRAGSQENKTEKKFYDKVGFDISKKAYNQYEAINNFIEKNTRPEDYVLVYPCGPYNHFTGRPSPLTAREGVYDLTFLGNAYSNIALLEMEERKPEYVVLNTYNGGVHIGAIRGDTSAQVSWRTEDSPNFSGNGSPLQFYILENYSLVKKFEYAAILKRNPERKEFIQNYRRTNIFKGNLKNVNVKGAEAGELDNQFSLTDRSIRVEFDLKNPLPASHIEIVFKFDTAIYKKLFTKGYLNAGIVGPKGAAHALTNLNDLSDLGKAKYVLSAVGPPTIEGVKEVKTIWVSFDTPKPYFVPEELTILDLKVVLDEKIYE